MQQEDVRRLESELRQLRQQMFCGDELHEQSCIQKIEGIKERLEPYWRHRYLEAMERRLNVYFL